MRYNTVTRSLPPPSPWFVPNASNTEVGKFYQNSGGTIFLRSHQSLICLENPERSRYLDTWTGGSVSEIPEGAVLSITVGAKT